MDAWLYSIEFQKRGLPHSHILLWLIKDSAIHPNLIDSVVSAEIPDKDLDPELFDIVVTNMIYGPFGDLNPTAQVNAKKLAMCFYSRYRDWNGKLSKI